MKLYRTLIRDKYPGYQLKKKDTREKTYFEIYKVRGRKNEFITLPEKEQLKIARYAKEKLSLEGVPTFIRKGVLYVPKSSKISKIKVLYHGSPIGPETLKQLEPRTPRGDNEFNTQTGIYLTDNKIEAMLYSMARDAERVNRSWGIKNGKLYLRKDNWLSQGPEQPPRYKLNEMGYLYSFRFKTPKMGKPDYEQNPYLASEYIVKHTLPITKRNMKIIRKEDIEPYIVYVTREEMDAVFA